jgi:hypothetical protein
MRVKIDEAAWMGAKEVLPEPTGPIQAVVRTGDTYRFMLAGRSDVIQAKVVDDEIDLQPDRSSAHKALLAALSE